MKRIFGLLKQSLFKATEKSKLTKQDLEKNVLYIQILWNNRTDKILQKYKYLNVISTSAKMQLKKDGKKIPLSQEQYEP